MMTSIKRLWSIIIVFLISFGTTYTAQNATSVGTSTAGGQSITTVAKKSVPSRAYSIDQMPLESAAYLRRIITSHNAVMRHAIISWLKNNPTQKEIPSTKELLYLLEQLDSIATVKQAVLTLTRAIAAHKAAKSDNPSFEAQNWWQERGYSALVLQSSVVLVSVAREQLLMILDQVNSSLVYWKMQQSHPVKYFFHKSPAKWLMGERQADEIAGNIKKLERLQHDMRFVLGRLTKHIYAFDAESDVEASYTWVKKLLSILSCVGSIKEEPKYEDQFDEIAEKLRFKLSRVSYLKGAILSHKEFASAIKPGHLARNWLLYTIAAFGVYNARNFYMQNTEWVNQILMNASESITDAGGAVISPIKRRWDTLFGSSAATTPEDENLLAKHAADIGKVLPGFEAEKNELAKAFSTEGPNMREVEVEKLKKLLESGKHTWNPFGGAWGENILLDVKSGKLDSLREVADNMSWYTQATLKAELKEILIRLELYDKFIRSLSIGANISSDVAQILYSGASSTQIVINYLSKSIKSSELSMELLTLIPAFGISLGVSKLYNWMREKDYSAVRLGLLDINSLFIESSTPLNNHDYGKLIYLLQGLRLEAMRYLTEKDMRSEFLTDIAKLESNNFSVETKRNIIKNMFMKYSFLQLNAKSA